MDWSITNDGRLQGGTVGITLAGSGAVTNAAGATISSSSYRVASYGVRLSGLGTIINGGTIFSSFVGVFLDAGGSAINGSDATIAGGSLQTGGGAITILGAGTVKNSGTISVGARNGGGIYIGSGTLINEAEAQFPQRKRQRFPMPSSKLPEPAR